MILRRYGKPVPQRPAQLQPRRDDRRSGSSRDRVVLDFGGRTSRSRYRCGDQASEVGADGRRRRAAPRRTRELLAKLERRVRRKWWPGWGTGRVLVVLNERDDWPKTRERREAGDRGGREPLPLPLAGRSAASGGNLRGADVRVGSPDPADSPRFALPQSAPEKPATIHGSPTGAMHQPPCTRVTEPCPRPETCRTVRRAAHIAL